VRPEFFRTDILRPHFLALRSREDTPERVAVMCSRENLVDYPAVPLAIASLLRKRSGGTAPPSESLIASANLADKMNQN
jgi:hypothetical protein